MPRIIFPELVADATVTLSNGKNYIYKNGALRSVETPVSGGSSDTLTEVNLIDPYIQGYIEANNIPEPGTEFTVSHTDATVHRFIINGDAVITLPTPDIGRSYLVEIVYQGAYTVTFECENAPIYWPKGTVPTPTSVVNAIDRYVFQETDGCILGNDGGRNFS